VCLGGSAVIGIVLLIAALFINSSFGQVPAGARGVVLRFGAPTGGIYNEGLFTIMPFVNTVEVMSVQTEAFEAQVGAASKDLQEVSTTVTLNYALEPDKVVETYRSLRRAYADRIVKPSIQEAVKAATAQFTAEQLITNRPAVREAINNSLIARLDEFGIEVKAMSITDFQFSEVFDTSIEAKVAAEQNALKAQRDLDRIKIEAAQQIAMAQAEAESLRLQKDNITPDLIELRRIEAQIMAIEKWNGVMPTVVLGENSIPLLEVFKQQ
jgi:regulator of protease activity HflC (stomatin/prohibitin superfamily)